jgi:hypothetical protein
MVAAGMLLIWGGYSVSLWGWCLLRGYNVTFGQLVSPVHPYGSRKGQVWPPPPIPASQVFPGRAQSDISMATGASQGLAQDVSRL